ncbi:hypothetical protein M3D75_11690 [Microbacterium enclense]|uniref:hypothetical protein n=1 Tax=Microbacterium enclense TaxID=993073 RepID=UPI0021A42549|nr:hypothetical protein [Microbacterium enclense]MCT2086779.1 hypothetical protein [Microbacterium enclense]
MSGVSQASLFLAARRGLFDAIKAALADEKKVDIRFALDWPVGHNDWVGITDQSSVGEARILDRARRQQDDEIEIALSIGSWRPGHGDEVATKAVERAHELLDLIQTYVRNGNNVTLGGAVLWCLPAGVEMNVGNDEKNNGYVCELDATFTCKVRIR